MKIYLVFYFFLIFILTFGCSTWAKNDVYVEKILQDTSATPTMNYGQIFIEETRESSSPFLFELSIAGGQEIGSPYIHSSFFGIEVKHRIHSLLYLGFEYSIHDSQINSAIETIEKKLDSYGFNFAYPFLKSMVYINWQYRFFKSHFNLAGFFKIRMEFPVQFGVGIMNIVDKRILFAVKWGGGPLIRLNPRWGIQLFFSQSSSLKETRFLYTWYSLNIIYSL